MTEKLEKTEQEWREELSPDRFHILRVAAAHGDDDGDPGVAAATEDQQVALLEALDG